MNRISKDDYFSDIAKVVAKRSTCIRHSFGCIIVNNSGEIISTGYNGAPRGLSHCLEIGCIRDHLGIESGTRHEVCSGVHAEQNALLQAGRQSKDSTLYVNGKPCKICAKMIINAQIARVVISNADEYPDIEGIKLLEEAGVVVDILS